MTPARACVAVLAVLGGCARPLGPPGGEVPTTAPGIESTVPEHGSTIEATSAPVVFRFDQPISERNIRDAIALVSPGTGRVNVDRSGHELRVTVEGGWQAGHIYRVLLLPGIRSRYPGPPERRTPVELIFSTGPPVVPTAIAGLVLDRITGRPPASTQGQVLVEARARGDTIGYRTVIDTGGFFALRHLPAQRTYDVSAFLDMNANLRSDSTESRSRNRALTLNRDTDTIPEVFFLLPADATPPEIVNAAFRDSLQVRLTTDDYLDPGADLERVDVRLALLPDSVEIPGARLMSTRAFERLRAPPDTGDLAPERPARGVPADTTLPVRELVLVPPAPLEPGRRYAVTVGALVNISGLYGGGGRVEFLVPERRGPGRGGGGKRTKS